MIDQRIAVVTVLSLGLILLPMQAAAIDVQQVSGGPAVTNLGYGIAVNKGSSLERTWYVLNSPDLSVHITNAGIATAYGDRNYSFVPKGELAASADVTALEVRFLLFDVFGEHIKTLGGTEVRDVPSGTTLDLSDIGSWRAWENDVSEFLTSVAFVARVRLSDGSIWQADMSAVQAAIANVKLQLTEEGLDLSEEE